jgi:hypothetical protein
MEGCSIGGGKEGNAVRRVDRIGAAEPDRPGFTSADPFAKPARTLSAASVDSKQRVTSSGKLPS